MHPPPPTPFRLLALSALATVLVCSPAQAVLPIISSGEGIIFSDDFADNSNGWTGVSVINGTGTPVTDSAVIGGGTWSPAVPGDGDSVSSVYTFAEPLNVLDGPISLYMRVRLDNASASSDASRFFIQMGESTGNRFLRLNIRDNANGSMEYRNAGGGGASTSTSTFNIPDNVNFFDFKVTLTAGSDVDQLATAEAFRFDTGTSSYVSLGIAASAVDLDSGLFNSLTIYNRNGTNGSVHFDSVAVTTTPIPEPSTFAALTGALVLLGATVRRRRDRSVR